MLRAIDTHKLEVVPVLQARSVKKAMFLSQPSKVSSVPSNKLMGHFHGRYPGVARTFHPVRFSNIYANSGRHRLGEVLWRAEASTLLRIKPPGKNITTL
jgi:hypothetical protein